MKHVKRLFIILLSVAVFLTCETDPLTGKTTMALVSDRELFAASFQQYEEFLKENTVITGTPEAEMVERLGKNIKNAAQRWYTYIGEPNYLKDYQWEYKLVQDDQINAWCMPGGKIVVYTGIMPVTKNEDGLATVMGHEVAHALLNHGKQRVSANFVAQLGLAAADITAAMLGGTDDSRKLLLGALGLGANLGVLLPFSREHESEADHYGLILMAIAGYNPEESVPFWERMKALGGGSIEFLSTHPSNDTRIKDLGNKSIPEAQRKAAKLHLDPLKKEAILKAKKIADEINNQ
ncbi:MAG: M48 family metallopeptidase [Treponema sp.]|jgi:predicted Zn-dependent protease|nr:M48 family metallopeptidase [Treponema sp.]